MQHDQVAQFVLTDRDSDVVLTFFHRLSSNSIAPASFRRLSAPVSPVGVDGTGGTDRDHRASGNSYFRHSNSAVSATSPRNRTHSRSSGVITSSSREMRVIDSRIGSGN